MPGSTRDHLVLWVNGRRLTIGAGGLPAAAPAARYGLADRGRLVPGPAYKASPA